jgi:hypothetical protein
VSRSLAAKEFSSRSPVKHHDPFILRVVEDLATTFGSAFGLPAEQRGARRGDGHEHDSCHGAHLQPFAEDDEAG